MLVSSTDISIFFKKKLQPDSQNPRVTREFTQLKLIVTPSLLPKYLPEQQDLLHYQSCVSRCSASLF